MMKMAFIGYKGSYDYNKIGGMDAFVRRISNYLSQKEKKIYLLSYGNEEYSTKNINDNIYKYSFMDFNDVLNFIKINDIKHSISIYLKPIDRLKLFFFHIKNKSLIFHTYIAVYNEKIYKRWLLFLESSITYNGKVFCISKRIYKIMKKISSKAEVLLPPVDDSFFNKEKKKHKKKIIGYMGRLDYGKGADLAYNYFLNSKLNRNEFEFCIYSYPLENDEFSKQLRNKLKSQNNITYIETKLFNEPEKLDEFIKKVIDDTDIFFLPYRFMSSTIDAPLVPMELMARNTPFISTELQAIRDINYTANNLLRKEDIMDIDIIDKMIKTNIDIYPYHKAIELQYRTSEISKNLLKSLEKFNE